MLQDVLDNVVRYGFEGDATKPIDVIVARRLHSLVVAVEERQSSAGPGSGVMWN
jgi:hypothetical protein